MGLIIGLVKHLIKFILFFLLFAAFIVLIPNLPPYTSFSSIKLEPTQQRVGPLAPNELLNNAERLHKDKLQGPEAFQLYNGELYTSLSSGEIVKLSPGGHVTFVTKLGQPCSGSTNDHICGRPLGFQIDERTNTLYVADAYHGIWKVDLKNDKKQLLVSPRVEIKGRTPKVFNSVALDQNGELYWTDSSSDFHLKDSAISVLCDPSGRLFHYNAAKNVSEVLLDGIWFANGITVSPDNQFIVVVESSRHQLIKYYINGPKKGKSEVFTSGIPGVPDNIRALPDGSGVLVALYTVFDDDHPMLTRSMSETPHARKFLARLQRLIEMPFEYLNSLYPHFVFDEIVYYIGHLKSVSSFTPAMSGLLQIDWKGNIVASYYNTDGSLRHISDAIIYNNKLYTGSPHEQNFIGAVSAPPLLKKAFDVKKGEKKQANPVQQETKPKVQEKKEEPKAKPVVNEPPKVKETVKPVQVVKPVIKQEEKKTPPPTQAPPKTQPPPATKPTTTTPKPEVKSTTSAPKPTTTTPKPEVKVSTPKPEVKSTTATPKQTTTTSKPAVKTSTPRPEVKSTQKAEAKVQTPPTAKPAPTSAQKKVDPPQKQKEVPKKDDKVKPQEIPIKEDIPSDTVQPKKETLKVIKKDGPTEIPNPKQ